ncbi:MAG: hypothetical protein Q9159_002053 [Coniocarpon cinnabarinum]
MDTVANLGRDSFTDDEPGRLKALAEARALCTRLETPWDFLVRQIWLQPSISAAIKVGQDLNLFEKLRTETEGATAEALAQATGSNPSLLRRILRLLASSRFIEEIDGDTFKGTDLSAAFTKPGFYGGMSHLFTQVQPMFLHLPEYLSQRGYIPPDDQTDGPWQFAQGSGESFFDWMASHPAEAKGFNDLMAVYHEVTQHNWLDIYPLTRLSGEAAKESQAPLVVDVGGGMGRDMENLRQRLPDPPPRLVVQDMELVVRQAEGAHPKLEYDAHDFFQDQPIHGAQCYFLHSVLHDWPDDLARDILRKLRPAMQVGHSKLLICENIMPERAQIPLAGALDLVMMGLLCSKERSEGQWRDLLDSAGFVVREIFGQAELAQCVIEAEPQV